MAIHCSQGCILDHLSEESGGLTLLFYPEGGGSQHPLGPVERPTQKIVANVKIASVKCFRKNKFAFNT